MYNWCEMADGLSSNQTWSKITLAYWAKMWAARFPSLLMCWTFISSNKCFLSLIFWTRKPHLVRIICPFHYPLTVWFQNDFEKTTIDGQICGIHQCLNLRFNRDLITSFSPRFSGDYSSMCISRYSTETPKSIYLQVSISIYFVVLFWGRVPTCLGRFSSMVLLILLDDCWYSLIHQIALL